MEPNQRQPPASTAGAPDPRGILPASEIVPTDIPKSAPRSPRSPGRDDPALASSAPDPHLKDNPYASVSTL